MAYGKDKASAPYEVLADYYDEFMELNYPAWMDFILAIHDRWGQSESFGRVMELGCGTGRMTEELLRFAVEVVAIDNSRAMLKKARERFGNKECVSFSCQDIRELDIDGKFDFILANCDVFNYLYTAEEVSKVLKSCQEVANPGSLLIFDISTEYKLREILADYNFTYESEDGSVLLWRNEINLSDRLEMHLTLFQHVGSAQYIRHDERQEQKIWEVEEIIDILNDNGIKEFGIYDELNFSYPEYDSERVFFVVRL